MSKTLVIALLPLGRDPVILLPLSRLRCEIRKCMNGRTSSFKAIKEFGSILEKKITTAVRHRSYVIDIGNCAPLLREGPLDVVVIEVSAVIDKIRV